MVDHLQASAKPQKRLFISLITRDIPLADALLDLIDNSVNASLEPLAPRLKTADDYQKFMLEDSPSSGIKIDIIVDKAKIIIRDNAGGISTKMAKDHVFQFGRDDGRPHENDRLSVYGIGLKRGMFKCGNKIKMISDHQEGGFELDLNAKSWATLDEEPWVFPIESRVPVKQADCGTTITISELHDNVVTRIEDGLFLSQLREKIARTYSFFITRIIDLNLNGSPIERLLFEIGDNYASEKFSVGTVSCNITAGIALSTGETYRDQNAGWFVFCNGRTVLYADKSNRTGWGGGGLPIFQPKHRPFLGTVFFVSPDPEELPWTTTKSSVNEDSASWQQAIRLMSRVGKSVVAFLDNRYSDDASSARPEELRSASGHKINLFHAATAQSRSFNIPVAAAQKTTKIQYDAARSDIQKITEYLRKPRMGGSEVGRYTFNYFLKNEVDGE